MTYSKIPLCERIIEARYSKQTYRRTKNRHGIQSGQFRTDRQIYGFKTVLTYDQREIRGQLDKKKRATGEIKSSNRERTRARPVNRAH